MNEEQNKVIEMAKEFAREKLGKDCTGHDYWHTIRVLNNSIKISEREGGEQFIIQLAAILHDIGDHKFENDTNIVKNWLKENDVEEIEKIMHIIENVSFKKGTKIESKEGMIVQDADRLDAIGAIGISRVFATGVHFKRPIYDPENEKNSIQHFYDKLLKLKDLMNTSAGKEMALSRHKYMEEFLQRFYEEWDGKK
ncbi:HD domain-containing protein [Candidatus Woesearchaeota archaeon]|nr:HD domain-containing protein [Candidatus Woesearchaeota archaeon]